MRSIHHIPSVKSPRNGSGKGSRRNRTKSKGSEAGRKLRTPLNQRLSACASDFEGAPQS